MLERHVQTIIVAATFAILSWVLLSVLDVRDRLTKFEERLVTLQSQIAQGTDDRFRGTDWRREKERIDERWSELKAAVDRIAERVSRLERAEDRYHPSGTAAAVEGRAR